MKDNGCEFNLYSPSVATLCWQVGNSTRFSECEIFNNVHDQLGYLLWFALACKMLSHRDSIIRYVGFSVVETPRLWHRTYGWTNIARTPTTTNTWHKNTRRCVLYWDELQKAKVFLRPTMLLINSSRVYFPIVSRINERFTRESWNVKYRMLCWVSIICVRWLVTRGERSILDIIFSVLSHAIGRVLLHTAILGRSCAVGRRNAPAIANLTTLVCKMGRG